MCLLDMGDRLVESVHQHQDVPYVAVDRPDEMVVGAQGLNLDLEGTLEEWECGCMVAAHCERDGHYVQTLGNLSVSRSELGLKDGKSAVEMAPALAPFKDVS